MSQSEGGTPEVRDMLGRLPELAGKAMKYMAANEAQTLESVAAYSFLQEEFSHGPVTENHLFQFLYRSFYRMDMAGLRSSFHKEYFRLMEASRGEKDLDLGALVWKLHKADFNQKPRPSIQFSFVTKLAHTVNPNVHPIYDSEIAKVFTFRQPQGTKPETRLERYLSFYTTLKSVYEEILHGEMLTDQIRTFCDQYVKPGETLPSMKIIDFIFWSAGKAIRDDEKKD
jgi:hypothetical protein